MPKYATAQDEWRAYLTATHPMVRRGRRVFGLIPSGPRCKLCHVPFGGPGGFLFKKRGFRRWEKNPNVCMRCLTGLAAGEVHGAEVEISLLFADVRGSSDLARRLGPSEFTQLMNRFYAAATEVLIEGDALLDKFVGDQVIGLFVPFMAGPNHTRQAIETAERLLRATGHVSPNGPWIPLGTAVHTGTAFVGVVSTRGDTHDFTAMGDPVNIAAHLAAQAATGEVLLTKEAAEAGRLRTESLSQRHLVLKGHAVDAIVLHMSDMVG